MYELPGHGKETHLIGYAGMTQDGTILMRVRSKGITPQPAVMFYAPGDAKYAEVFAHFGGMSPGQTETLTPFSIPHTILR